MVRLVLVLAPGLAILSGVALTKFCNSVLKANPASGNESFKHSTCKDTVLTATPRSKQQSSLLGGVAEKLRRDRVRFQAAAIFGLVLLLFSFLRHCISIGDEYYSSPSIILSSRSRTGQFVIFDDFREAYWWLRQNTNQDSRVMSWWDYGYQLGSIANRTTLVDNNTWNNTHISLVGQAMMRSEAEAVKIMRELDVNYVLVLFGGLIGFSGDDISKSIWMIKIGASTDTGRDIEEERYFSLDGDFRIDELAGPALKNSLLYRMCYYKFDQVVVDRMTPPGFDRVRNQRLGIANITFEHLEEAFTSSHWIVRIFRVKDIPNMKAYLSTS